MKLSTFTLLAFLLSCIGCSAACTDDSWDLFKNTFEKHYNSAQEELSRRAVFCVNIEMIHAHNERYGRGEETFEMGVNQFADWTNQEFLNWLHGAAGVWRMY